MPRLASISSFPKMWELEGTSLKQLTGQLVELAFERCK
jgi:hypothetical protein